MQHPEPEDLALVALGEVLDDATRSHLDTCPTCAEDVATLSGAVSVGRSVSRDGGDTLVAPPAAVWGRIRVELDLPADLDPGEPLTGPVDTDEEQVVPERPAAEETSPAAHTTPTDLRTVRDRRSRPRSSAARWLAVAAASAGVVVGGAGATWWAGRGEPAPAVIEAAALDALPAWSGAAGEAKVEVAADGSRRLVITLTGAQPGDGYREVWLIDTDVTKLVSLGVLDGTTGTFPLPAGLDLAEFPVVDVSEEHFDGDPAHSGDSIVRGILEA